MATAPKFDPDFIKSQLASLTSQHMVAFAATCCERMLPNYRRFVEQTGWGDEASLRMALDVAWDLAAGNLVSKERLEILHGVCENATPDTEDFPILLASHALDAGVGICETLRLCIDADVSHAINAATSARDTVDMHIQERDNMDYQVPGFEEQIRTDPLMIREVLSQLDDLVAIRKQVRLEPEFVRQLQEKYRGVSNLG